MKGLSDTDPRVEAMVLDMLRSTPLERRFALMADWSRTLMQASYQQILRRVGDESRAKLEWVRVQYGEEVAARLAKHL